LVLKFTTMTASGSSEFSSSALGSECSDCNRSLCGKAEQWNGRREGYLMVICPAIICSKGERTIENLPPKLKNPEFQRNSGFSAERVRFELTEPLRVQRFSRPSYSTALAPLQVVSILRPLSETRVGSGLPAPISKAKPRFRVGKYKEHGLLNSSEIVTVGLRSAIDPHIGRRGRCSERPQGPRCSAPPCKAPD
jgi:hypothetical protein